MVLKALKSQNLSQVVVKALKIQDLECFYFLQSTDDLPGCIRHFCNQCWLGVFARGVFAFCSRQLVFPWNVEWWPLAWSVGELEAQQPAIVLVFAYE